MIVFLPGSYLIIPVLVIIHYKRFAARLCRLYIFRFLFSFLLVKISLWFCSGTCVTYLYILYKSMNICIPNKRLDKNFLNFVFYIHSSVFYQNRSGCFVLDFSVLAASFHFFCVGNNNIKIYILFFFSGHSDTLHVLK